MKLVDTNVLLYAVDSRARHHVVSREWLVGALRGIETIGFSWLTIVGFIRIATNPGVYEQPLTLDEAVDQTQRWLQAGPSRLLRPAPDHLEIIRRILEPLGTAGNLVSDAHLAAMALHHRATVVTFDNDFGRFAGVTWEPPS